MAKLSLGTLTSQPPQVIAGGSRNPILLDDPAVAYRIRRGHFDIFAVRDSVLSNRRHHLFRLPEESLLFGLPHPAGAHIGLVAVGSLDSELEVVPHYVPVDIGYCEPWINGFAGAIGAVVRNPLARTAQPGAVSLPAGSTLYSDPRAIYWVEIASGEATIAGTDMTVGPGASLPLAGGLRLDAQTELQLRVGVRESLTGADLALFDAACQRAFVDRIAPTEPAAPRPADLRAQAELHDSIARLAGVHKKSAADGAPSRFDPLQASLLAIFAALRVTPQMAAFDLNAQGDASVDDRVSAIIRQHRLASRIVLLRHGWESREGPPLLAYFGDQRQPVALIHVGRRWLISDAGTSRPLDAEDIAALAPEALQIYATLPTTPLRFADLFKFGLVGTGPALIRVAVLMLFGAILGAAMPLASDLIVDEAMPRGELGTVGIIILGLVAATLATAVFEGVKGMAMLAAELRFESRAQPALIARMLNLPTAFFRAHPVGDIVDRVLGIQQARQILSTSAAGAIVGSIFSLASLVPILIVDVRIALLAFGLALVLGAATAAISYGRLRHERRRIAQNGRLDSFVLQMLMGVTKLRASATEPMAFARWAEHYRTNMRYFLAAERWGNIQKVAQALLPQLALIALYAAILMWMKSDAHNAATAVPQPGNPHDPPVPFSAGDFVAVSVGFAQVVGAISALADALTQSLTAVPLIERAKPLIETPLDLPPIASGPTKLSGAIDIRDVSFRYSEKSPLALDNVSFRINKGDFVAIVGASGSGKSTLMRLLLGFEKPESGDIFYDGCSIQRLDLSTVRRQIGVVLQHGRIFSGSIYSNIIGQTSSLGMEEALAAARLVGLDADIEAMPMGLHTVLLDGGATLSGGQRQRILIARALVNQPAILMLDEATSALDNRTQAIVTETLGRLAVTRVVIAHRLSTIEAVDRIVVLERGKVVETGGFKELMERNGHFAAHARRQLV